MSIKIVTDSTTSFTPEEAKRLDLSIVPLKTIFGEEEYLDGIELSPEDFYIKLAQSKELPSTSQPTPFEFEQVFRTLQAEGHQIIAICMASGLSGTWESAQIAQKDCGGDIWVIDSGTTTLSLQILVRRALELIDMGKTAEEVVQILEVEKKRVYLFAVIDTLEYLYKGGRLSRTSAFAGTLFNVKPLLSLTQNELTVAGKARGLKKAHAEALRLVDSVGGIDYSMPFAIGYTGDDSNFGQFEQECEKYFAGHKPYVDRVSSVIGTHCGPGAVAIVFFKNE